MWSLILSKTGAFVVSLVVIMILVGALLFKNISLKSQLAEANTQIEKLDAQIQNAQKAVAETKQTLVAREKEVALANAQVVAGNKAVQEYRSRIDKSQEILAKAKCVNADEKMGVIDAGSNEEIIDHLNCLTYGSCDKLLSKTNN